MIHYLCKKKCDITIIDFVILWLWFCDCLIRLDKTEVAGLSTKHVDYIAAMCYAGKGLLYIYGNSFALAPDGLTNPYLSFTSVPIVVDLKQKTMTLINGMEI